MRLLVASSGCRPGQMRLADDTRSPKVEIDDRGIEVSGPFVGELIVWCNVESLKIELLVRLLASQKLNEFSTPRQSVLFLLLRTFPGVDTSRTEAIRELAAPNAGAREGLSSQKNSRKPRPGKGPVAGFAIVNLEKGCHICLESVLPRPLKAAVRLAPWWLVGSARRVFGTAVCLYMSLICLYCLWLDG